MQVALAQINATLGDFKSNREKILEFAIKAKKRRCDVVIFPEASLFGYHPVDLLERPSVVETQLRELEHLHQKLPEGIVALVGAITKNPKKGGKPYNNSAVALEKGKKPKIYAKQLLPTYDVFDETRHIEPGDMSKNILKVKGKKILVTICEDIWAWPDILQPLYASYGQNPIKQFKKNEFDYVFNLSASPFTDTKLENRLRVTTNTVKALNAPMVYVNMVGAQDELIFDGGSFTLDKKGNVICRCMQFEEDINVVNLEQQSGVVRERLSDPVEIRRQALVLGLRDFIKKLDFKHVHLGLSGGVDSALVACLAADAIGPRNVTAIALPGPYSSEESLRWAKELTSNLGINWVEMPISPIYDVAKATVDQGLGKLEFGVVHENIQARLRGMLLMAFSNHNLSLLLNTSNKSEFAMGYSTLYGDMAGGLCVIGDLLKTQVFELARHYNRQSELIPQGIIDRPPSAELRPNQKDEDTLPPYNELDPLVELIVKQFEPARGAKQKAVLAAMMKSEFKRWQAPPILKVSDHAFGRGRRLPLAHKAWL